MTTTRPSVGTGAALVAVVFVAVATASLMMPLGIDEITWLSIGRRAAGGGVLYVDAIDNKSPVVFGLVYLVDLLPGPFQMVRAGVVAALAGWLAYGSSRLAIVSGLERTAAVAVGLLAGIGAAAMSSFLLTTELAAVSLSLGAALLVARGHPAWGAVASVGAALFDPRAVLFIPGLVVLARERGSRASATRFGAVAVTVAAAITAFILANDDFRYALIELNVASRQVNTWQPVSQLAVAAASLLPVFAVVALLRRGGYAMLSRPAERRAGWMLLIGGFVGAAVSLQPFHHYWVLILPWIGVVLISRAGATERIPTGVMVSIVALAMVPLLINAAGWRARHQQMLDDFGRVATSIEAAGGDERLFVQFDLRPHTSYLLPERSAMRSPVVNYLVWPSSRRADHLSEIEALMPEVGAIVDSGGLSSSLEAVQEDARLLWAVLRAHLGDFPCEAQFGDVTVHLRASGCAAALQLDDAATP